MKQNKLINGMLKLGLCTCMAVSGFAVSTTYAQTTAIDVRPEITTLERAIDDFKNITPDQAVELKALVENLDKVIEEKGAGPAERDFWINARGIAGFNTGALRQAIAPDLQKVIASAGSSTSIVKSKLGIEGANRNAEITSETCPLLTNGTQSESSQDAVKRIENAALSQIAGNNSVQKTEGEYVDSAIYALVVLQGYSTEQANELIARAATDPQAQEELVRSENASRSQLSAEADKVNAEGTSLDIHRNMDAVYSLAGKPNQIKAFAGAIELMRDEVNVVKMYPELSAAERAEMVRKMTPLSKEEQDNFCPICGKGGAFPVFCPNN